MSEAVLHQLESDPRSNPGLIALLRTDTLRIMQGDGIISDPNVMVGKPAVAGTRITVELILEKLAAGESVEQILSEHPRLSGDAVRAVVASRGKHFARMLSS